MHNSKKGVEQPQLIVYVLFTVILTLTGIYVGFIYLGGVDAAFEFQDYASRLNIVTSNIINSPNCFAVEQSYTTAAGGTFYQVDTGKINWTRFNSTDGNKILSDCSAAGKNQTWVKLTFLNSGVSDTIYSGAEPTDEWTPAERNVIVLIQDGNSVSLGRLEVRLKG
jgi:hypothetical protein